MFGLSFNIGNKIIIGSSLKQAASGLVGCMRDLEINGVEIEPRRIVKTGRVVGEIALDNCKYVDPCKRPNTCKFITLYSLGTVKVGSSLFCSINVCFFILRRARR